MRSVQDLLDEAAETCGSDAALARRIGVPLHHPYEWRNGKRQLSPEAIGLLCNVLQLDAEEARRLLALSVVQNPKNAEKAGVLRQAFFVSAAGLAVAIGALIQTADARASTLTHPTADNSAAPDRLYIM